MPKKTPTTPYRTRPGETPLYLADRGAYEERFREYLEEGSHIRLIGPRGTGKSVLLTHYGIWAKEANWVPVFLNLKDDFRDEDKFRTEFREALSKGRDQISKVRGLHKKPKTCGRPSSPNLCLEFRDSFSSAASSRRISNPDLWSLR